MSGRDKRTRRDPTANQRVGDISGRIDGRVVDIRPSILGGSGVCELLTAKDLEALLKIDVKTIYAYVQAGKIPYVRIESNLRFIKSQIFDWIAERNYRPRPMNGRKAN